MINKITQLNIEKFRHLENLANIKIGNKLTIIAGGNGNGKSSILGLLGHVFSYRDDAKKIIKSFDNKPLETQFSEVFRFSIELEKESEYKYNVVFENEEIKSAESRYSLTENRYRIDVGDRSKSGEGKMHRPVYYLGLKRLYPLAQESDKSIVFDDENKLTESDIALYKKWHNEILVLNDEISPKHTKTRNKELYSPTSNRYDAHGNSAGQDNIAQIIMSILSFKRLKEQLGDNYSGGVLLIDELDVTLYPAAQINLINLFLKAAGDYDLQIIFTTHSLEILNYTLSKEKRKFENNTELIFLYRRRNQTVLAQKIEDIQSIIDELNHSTSIIKKVDDRINTYFEDDEARIF